MELKQKKIIILWLKRILGLTAITLWMYILYTISQSSVPFMEQIPYCMGSTMLTFGFISMLFKGLTYWEKQE